MSLRVLVVDSDAERAAGVVYALTAAGYLVASVLEIGTDPAAALLKSSLEKRGLEFLMEACHLLSKDRFFDDSVASSRWNRLILSFSLREKKLKSFFH